MIVVRVQASFLNQEGIDDGIEESVVVGIVEMAVLVVIRPP